MKERIHEYASKVRDGSGAEFTATVFGQKRNDGTWSGWIEFKKAGEGESLETDQETSQPNRTDLEYWAAGLEPVYLEGARRRATDQARRARTERPDEDAPRR